jgi:hypothetical protein
MHRTTIITMVITIVVLVSVIAYYVHHLGR